MQFPEKKNLGFRNIRTAHSRKPIMFRFGNAPTSTPQSFSVPNPFSFGPFAPFTPFTTPGPGNPTDETTTETKFHSGCASPKKSSKSMPSSTTSTTDLEGVLDGDVLSRSRALAAREKIMSLVGDPSRLAPLAPEPDEVSKSFFPVIFPDEFGNYAGKLTVPFMQVYLLAQGLHPLVMSCRGICLDTEFRISPSSDQVGIWSDRQGIVWVCCRIQIPRPESSPVIEDSDIREVPIVGRDCFGTFAKLGRD